MLDKQERKAYIPAMDDAEFAQAMGLTDAEAAQVLPTLTPEKRATHERLIKFGDDWNLYAVGLGPKPTGALIDTEHSTSRRKAWR